MISKIEFSRFFNGRWIWLVYGEDMKNPVRKSWDDFPTFPDAQKDLAVKIRENIYEFGQRIGRGDP